MVCFDLGGESAVNHVASINVTTFITKSNNPPQYSLPFIEAFGENENEAPKKN